MAKTDAPNTAIRRSIGHDCYLSDGFLVRNKNLKVSTDIATFASQPGGDEIVIALLDAGMVVLGIDIFYGALGGGNLSVGDPDDSSRYKDSFSVAVAGQNTDMKAASVGYVIGTNVGDDEILATITGGPLTGDLKVIVTYI